MATLTENDTDGEEANGYLSAWAFDAQGMLLDGSAHLLEEGEQILAGESWIFEKRIGSWVTLEQEEDARVEAAGYRLLTTGKVRLSMKKLVFVWMLCCVHRIRHDGTGERNALQCVFAQSDFKRRRSGSGKNPDETGHAQGCAPIGHFVG